MANIKISELNELTQEAYDDYLPIVDTSADETKKISVKNLTASGVQLIAVTDTEPEEYETGDKYYNTTNNKIYTAKSYGWDLPETPIRNIFYIILDTQNIYTYDMDNETLVSVGGGAGGETLPVGSEIDFDGTSADIPTGWEQITNNANIISDSGITSISFTSSNGYGRVWLFSSLCLSMISFDGTNQTPVITDIWGTHQFTASISGNVITLSSLNNWDHYIFMGTNNISKIE